MDIELVLSIAAFAGCIFLLAYFGCGNILDYDNEEENDGGDDDNDGNLAPIPTEEQSNGDCSLFLF